MQAQHTLQQVDLLRECGARVVQLHKRRERYSLHRFPRRATVFLTGSGSVNEFNQVIGAFKERGTKVIVVQDAVTFFEPLHQTFLKIFAELGAQSATTLEAKSLMKAPDIFLSAYPSRGVAVTVAVIMDDYQRTVVIERADHLEEGGKVAFPGVIARRDETVFDAGARALLAETGLRVTPGELELVSVQSNPLRDRRGPIIDIGMRYVVPPEQLEVIKAAMRAGTDAKVVRIVPTQELMRGPMAWDHSELLYAAVKPIVRLPQPLSDEVDREALFAELAQSAGVFSFQKVARPGAKGYYEVEVRQITDPQGETVPTIERPEGEFVPQGGYVLKRADDEQYPIDAVTLNRRWKPVAGKVGIYCPRPVPTRMVVLTADTTIWTMWGEMSGKTGSLLARYTDYDFAIVAADKFVETYEGSDEEAERIFAVIAEAVKQEAKPE